MSMKELDFMSVLHKSTSRDYLARVNDQEYPKAKAAKLAKKKVLDKFYPNYKDMPLQQKVKIDQIVAAKYGGMINKIAMRSAKVVKKNELIKVKQARLKKQDA